MFGPKKKFGRNFFESENNLGQKFVWVKKKSGSEIFWVKKIWIRIFFWVQKNLGQKFVWVKKHVGRKFVYFYLAMVELGFDNRRERKVSVNNAMASYTYNRYNPAHCSPFFYRDKICIRMKFQSSAFQTHHHDDQIEKHFCDHSALQPM